MFKCKSGIFSLLLIVLVINSCQSPHEDRSWRELHNGIYGISYGKPGAYSLLSASGSIPRSNDLEKFDALPFPLDKSKISIAKIEGKLHIRLPLDATEHIYGLGLHFKGINRRGKVYNLKVDHYGGSDNGRTHAPVPFYISSNGYGVLINSAKYLTVYAGSANRVNADIPAKVQDRNTDKSWTASPLSDAMDILVPGEEVEIIVFNGSSLMEIVQKYNLYCGGGVLPPKWGLGFTYRTHTLYSAEDVLKEADAFEQNGFPLDFIGLEPGWQSMSYPCSFEWDPIRFPDPEKFMEKMREKKVRINQWANPYISPKADLYKEFLPYAGSHTVWNGIVTDFTIEEARLKFKEFYKLTHLDIGVSGLKIDEVDGYDSWLWPDVATFPSGTTAEEMRQTYGLLIQDLFTEMYHETNTRTYGLVRASNAGASRFPFVIYNDYYKHEDFITALINSGFSGLLWTPEARSSASSEEWMRRIQSVCFSPMAMINAWASGTKPWSYPDVYEQVKDVALLRMRLLPYIYSTFAEYHFNGKPVIRPMVLLDAEFAGVEPTEGELNDVSNPYKLAVQKDVKDQYLFGENILVAPVFKGQYKRRVILPPGKWYDFYTGEFVGENETITLEPLPEDIPLFVRDGGIIPMIPPVLHAPEPGEQLQLEIRHYGESPGSFTLYDDDGVSYDYEKGVYSLTSLNVLMDQENKLKGEIKRNDSNIFSYKDITWTFMTK